MPASSRFSPPSGRPLGRAVLVLLVWFAVLCVATVAFGWLVTHPLGSAFRGENGVNRWFADQRTSDLTRVADGGTLIGETLTGVVVLVVLGVAFAVRRRTWWPIVFVAVLDAGLGLFYLAGTQLDPRQRPPVHILQAGLVPDASFPSGHTGTATAIGGTAAALLWAYTRIAKPLLVLLALVPAYTMVSRLYVGAHHVSDVLTAFVYAGLWLLLCARMLLPSRATPADQPGHQPGEEAGSPSRKSVDR
jgi:membrane-associated phospholipid phosphatase